MISLPASLAQFQICLEFFPQSTQYCQLYLVFYFLLLLLQMIFSEIQPKDLILSTHRNSLIQNFHMKNILICILVE